MICNTKYLTGSSWNNKQVLQRISKKTLMLMFYEIFVAKLSYYWIEWAGDATWHTWTNIEEGIMDATLFSNWGMIQKTYVDFQHPQYNFGTKREECFWDIKPLFSPYFYCKT